MKIYLCGQRSFGAAALVALVGDGHEVVGVSAPLKGEDGREDRLWGEANARRLRCMPSGQLNAYTLPAGVDLIVCAHSHDFIGRTTRNRAKHGGIGYHPSLLPLHRGRDAIIWTIKMGDRVTGGSVYWLSDAVDGGAIAAQEFCFVRPSDTASELWRRDLYPLGVKLLRQVTKDVARGHIVRVPQDNALATWEPSYGRAPMHRPDLPMLCAVNNDETRNWVVGPEQTR